MSGECVLVKRAEDSVRAGQWDEAIESLEELRSQQVRSSFVYSNLAQAMAVKGRFLTVLSVYLEWAESALEAEQLEQAEQALGYALSLRPDSVEAREMGVRVSRQGNDPSLLSERLLSLSSLCLEVGDGEKAIAAMKEALELGGNSLALQLKLADLYVSLGQINSAVEQYQNCIEALRDSGDFSQMRETLRRLKMLRPDDVTVLLELGRVCLQLDLADEAEDQFRTVLKLDLENQSALLELARACRRNGRFRNGLLAINRLLQFNEDSSVGRTIAGQILLDLGETQDALVEFRKAVEIQLASGEREQAVGTLKRILTIVPSDEKAKGLLEDLGVSLEPLQDPVEQEVPVVEVSPVLLEAVVEQPIKQELSVAPLPRPALVRKSDLEESKLESKPLFRKKKKRVLSERGLRKGLRPKGETASKPFFEAARASADPEPSPQEEHNEQDFGLLERSEERDLEPVCDGLPLNDVPAFEEIFVESIPEPEPERTSEAELVVPVAEVEVETEPDLLFPWEAEWDEELEPVREDELVVPAAEVETEPDLLFPWETESDEVLESEKVLEPVLEPDLESELGADLEWDLELIIPEPPSESLTGEALPSEAELPELESVLGWEAVTDEAIEPTKEPERVAQSRADIDPDVLFPLDAQNSDIFKGFDEDGGWSTLFPIEPESEEIEVSEILPDKPFAEVDEACQAQQTEVAEQRTLSPEITTLLEGTLPQDEAVQEPMPRARIEDHSSRDVADVLQDCRIRLEQCPSDERTAQRLAEICLKHGLFAEAFEHFGKLNRLNPGCPEITAKVIKTALWLEDYESAKSALWELSRLYFDRGELILCQEKLGEILSLETNHKKARQLMVDVFMADGREKLAAWHLSKMVDQWVAEGDHANAISALQRLNDVAPSESAQRKLASLLQAMGRVDESVQISRQLRELYRDKQNWQEATEFARQVVELQAEDCADRKVLIELLQELELHKDALTHSLKLAELQRQQGRPGDACEVLRTILRHEPQCVEAHESLVEVYFERDERELANRHLESLADLLLMQKNYQFACSVFEKWANLYPVYSAVRERLAQFYQLNGDLDGAKLEWLLVTENYLAQGDCHKARRSLEMALELEPEQHEWRLRLAKLLQNDLLDSEGALTEYRRIFAGRPELSEATELYSDLLVQTGAFSELGQVLVQLSSSDLNGSFRERILRSVQKRMEEETEPSDLAMGWGRLCLEIGDIDSAIEQFQRLRRKPNFEFFSYRYLGSCFAQKRGFNMQDLALSQFSKALEFGAPSAIAELELRFDMGCVLQEKGLTKEALEQLCMVAEIDSSYRDVVQRVTSLKAQTS